MRLSQPFIKLPWIFDADRLAAEIAQIDDAAWMKHPTRMNGNTAVALISRDGGDNDDFEGSMATTPHLKRCEYLQQVLASFDQVLGRTRLMKLASGAEVATHVDFNYHWYSRVRIHVPIVTTPDVMFFCGPEQTHMAAGESWIFDSWRRHRVINGSSNDRIHLVIDTAGSATFWRVVRAMEKAARERVKYDAQLTPYIDGKAVEIRAERYNIAAVMAPGEMSALAEDLITDFQNHAANDRDLVERYADLLRSLCADWRELWSQYGSDDVGIPHYKQLLSETQDKLDPNKRALVTSSNQIGVNPVIVQRILRAALGFE